MQAQQSFIIMQAPLSYADMLLAIREKTGKTQKELAEGLSAKQNQVSQWESETNIPTVKFRTKIRELYKQICAWYG